VETFENLLYDETFPNLIFTIKFCNVLVKNVAQQKSLGKIHSRKNGCCNRFLAVYRSWIGLQFCELHTSNSLLVVHKPSIR